MGEVQRSSAIVNPPASGDSMNAINGIKKIVDVTKHSFGIALSFPGEARETVKLVAHELERILGPHSYFYDSNYQSQLASPELDILLQKIYARSKLIVVFLSSAYQQKSWCGIEWRAVREIIKKREGIRVMLIRMDDGDVDGIFETDGFIDARLYSPAQLAEFIWERLSILE